MFYLFFAWPVMALIGLAIGALKGRAGFGLVMGLFFGPLGWLIVAMMPTRESDRHSAVARSAQPHAVYNTIAINMPPNGGTVTVDECGNVSTNRTLPSARQVFLRRPRRLRLVKKGPR